LPYLGEKALYQEFHLDEPWDSDHNKKLIQRMPKVFSLPRSPLNSLGKTVYLAPTGKGLAFEGTKGIGLRDILDGTMATIFLVEVDDAHAVTWTKPEDLAVDLNDPRKGLGRHFGAGSLVGFLGGSVDLVRDRVSKATLRAAFTGNGGEVMGPDW
jgi:hypothetical protein